METGWIDGSDPNSTDLEDYNTPGNGTPAAIDSHNSVFTPESTAFKNMIAVINGGEATAFAPDERIVAGRGSVTVDGIDVPDYDPKYIQVE